jgi:hypothetical protein
MSITLGSNTLNYTTNGDKYIITYISADCNPVLRYIDTIFNSLFPHFEASRRYSSNRCGELAEYVCKHLVKSIHEELKIDGLMIGKIIIINWVEENEEFLEIIKSVYGRIGTTIRAHYHALAYLEIPIAEKRYCVAIETTLCEPYKLQFCVGSDYNELENTIKIRYQCSDFKISFDCDKNWYDIAYMGGKKRKKRKQRKTKKRRSKRNTKRKRSRKSQRRR